MIISRKFTPIIHRIRKQHPVIQTGSVFHVIYNILESFGKFQKIHRTSLKKGETEVILEGERKKNVTLSENKVYNLRTYNIPMDLYKRLMERSTIQFSIKFCHLKQSSFDLTIITAYSIAIHTPLQSKRRDQSHSTNQRSN